jgi:hypothetical protein
VIIILDWRKIKIPKKEVLKEQLIGSKSHELIYIITKEINEEKFYLYKVNSNYSITKLEHRKIPDFKQKSAEVLMNE